MKPEILLAAIGEACPDHSFETRTMPVDETVIEIPAACLEDVVNVLRNTFSIYHLSTITGQDRAEELELLYHFWHGQGITLRVRLSRENPCVTTLTNTIPGADFYEREVAEMLGVTFEGHPGPEHLLLPEDWESRPPLHKERSAEGGDA